MGNVEIEILRLVWLLQNHRFDVAGNRWGFWTEHIVAVAAKVCDERLRG